MEFLLLLIVVPVLAQVWVSWTSRTRKAPGVEQTMAAHQRALAAMALPVPGIPAGVSSSREG